MNPNETSFTVRKEDIVAYSRFEAFSDAVGAWSFGLLGFLPLSVGTGLFDALLLVSPFAFLLSWFAVGFALAIPTYYARPTILHRLFVGRDFQNVFQPYRRFVYRSYALAIALAIIGVPLSYSPTPGWRSAGLVLAGLAYFAMVPGFTTARVLKPDNDARLSLLQFLRERKVGNPDYSWLRRGLRRIEKRLPRVGTIGMTVSRDTLFLGCSYRIFTGVDVEPDLVLLSDWVVNPTKNGNPSIEGLLQGAGEAKALELSPVPTTVDRILSLSRFGIPLITPATVAILTILGVSPSLIQEWQDLVSKVLP